MQNNLEIGVKVNRQDIEREFGQKLPDAIKSTWGKVQNELAQSPSTLGKAFEERMGGHVKNMERLALEASAKGFFTPASRREFEKDQREVNALFKRFTDDRIAYARDAGTRLEKEIINLSEREKKARGKEADDLRRMMAQKYKELGDLQAWDGANAAVAQERARGRQSRRMGYYCTRRYRRRACSRKVKRTLGTKRPEKARESEG